MKIKAIQFGTGRGEDSRMLPAIGRKTGLFVGEVLRFRGAMGKVAALDYDRGARMLTVRIVGDDGKPWRLWDDAENCRPGRECDALQFAIEGCFLFADDEQQGQQQRGK